MKTTQNENDIELYKLFFIKARDLNSLAAKFDLRLYKIKESHSNEGTTVFVSNGVNS